MITADLAQRRVALGIGSIESARRIALSAIVRMVRNDRFQALPLRYDADSPPHGGSAATASLPPKGEPVSKQDATDKRDFPLISCSCVVLCVASRLGLRFFDLPVAYHTMVFPHRGTALTPFRPLRFPLGGLSLLFSACCWLFLSCLPRSLT